MPTTLQRSNVATFKRCNVSTTRTALAALRFLFTYALLCAGLLLFLFLLRNHIECQGRPCLSASSVSPAIQDAPANQIPFKGVNVSLEQYETSSERRAALARLRSADFGWVRQRIDWGAVEPDPQAYRWSETDAIIADIVASGLVPVLVLDGSPEWARALQDRTNPFAPPEDYAGYVRFVTAVAVRYGDDVRFYQIWDEPNIAPHWGDRLVEPVAYARLLRQSSTAVRRADRDAVILLAALAPTVDRGHTAVDEVHYLRRLYASGAAPYFDAVAIQPFGFGQPPDDPRSRIDVLNFQRAQLVRRVMVTAGDGETPIWAVRFGWNRALNSNWRTVTPENQIRFAQQALDIGRSWPWMATMAWAIDRPISTGADADGRQGFALVTASGQETDLLAALASLHQPQTSNGELAPISDRLLAVPLQAPATVWRTAIILSLISAIGLAIWRLQRALRIVLMSIRLNRWLSNHNRMVLWFILAVTYYLATWPPLIGLILVVATLMLLVRPLDGLLLTTVLLPFHSQHKEINLLLTVWYLSPAQASLLCTAAAVLLREAGFPDRWPGTGRVYRLRAGSLWGSGGATWLAGAWVVVAVLPAANAWHRPAFFAGLWAQVVVPLMGFLLVRLLVGDGAGSRPSPFQAPYTWSSHPPMRRTRVAKALALGGVLAATAGLAMWLQGEGVVVDGLRRFMGITFSPNQAALYLLRTMFVTSGILFTVQGRERWIWAGGVVLVSVALLLTGSRGALLLGLPAGMFVALLLLSWQRRVLIRVALLLGAMIALSLLLLHGRLLNSETVLSRLAIWRGTVDLWADYLWIGVGHNGFVWNYPAYMLDRAADEPNILHPHNLWLNAAATGGVLGVMWQLSMVGWLLVRVRRLWHCRHSMRLTVWLVAAVVAGLAHGQVDAFWALPELAAWNWMVIGLVDSGQDE